MYGAALPVWAIALFLAALSPFVARALASAVERRARERTVRLFAGSKEGAARQKEDVER